jgi:hypothetical protein
MCLQTLQHNIILLTAEVVNLRLSYNERQAIVMAALSLLVGL